MSAEKRAIEICRVQSKRELMDFIRFPWKVYRENKHWVPPLIREQKRFLGPANPFFQHAEAEYYLARRGGTTCGRISVSIDHRYVEYSGEKMGCFGFLEVLNDFEVASCLLDTAVDRLRQEGTEVMRGPFNFTSHHECGLLVDGFDKDPMVLMPYNLPYYAELLDKYGLKKTLDLHSYYNDDIATGVSYIRRLAKKAEGNRVVARKIDLKDPKGEMERVKELYNNAFQKRGFCFVPLTDAEVEDIAAHLKNLIIDDLAYIGEIDGRPVGFMMFIPDYNVVFKKMNGKMGPFQMLKFLWYKNRIKRGRGFLGGVQLDHQGTGVLAAMAVKAYDSAIRRGFKGAEFSWVAEDNIASRTMFEMFGAKIHKTHRVYEMPLT
jgi:hypothetical protein